jgi:hypothetical protein
MGRNSSPPFRSGSGAYFFGQVSERAKEKNSMESREVLDVRYLRGLLGEHRITRKHLARAAGLNPHYVSRILCGFPAGELATLKLERGLRQLGLEGELQRAG